MNTRISIAGVYPEHEHRCSECRLGEYCFPHNLPPLETDELDHALRISRPLQAGEPLYRIAEPVRAIYAVREGSFKTVALDSEGYEQVVSFHLPGEVFGLEGMYAGSQQCDAIALQNSRVCILPYKGVLQLSHSASRFTERMFQLFSKDHMNHLRLLGNYSAEERLAAFFIGLAERIEPRGQAASDITLPMSRGDIANYLRLAGETLSRALARFQRQDLIQINNRELRFLDIERLRHMGRRVPPYVL